MNRIQEEMDFLNNTGKRLPVEEEDFSAEILSLDQFRRKVKGSNVKKFGADIYDGIFDHIEHLKEM